MRTLAVSLYQGANDIGYGIRVLDLKCFTTLDNMFARVTDVYSLITANGTHVSMIAEIVIDQERTATIVKRWYRGGGGYRGGYGGGYRGGYRGRYGK